MRITDFLSKLLSDPETISFQDTMAVIDANYNFTPCAFKNGETYNEAGQNNGSCKLFGFAQLQQLNETQTLACFGSFYRDDVLKHPEGQDHQNIRNFMRFGWEGIVFQGQTLAAKSS